MHQNDHRRNATRISISLPADTADELDKMLSERGFHNRSQGILEMIKQNLIEHDQQNEESIMAGTITLFYDSSKSGLLEKLAQIQRENIEECISSQHVLLEGDFIMEVVLVQGPVGKLRHITNRMLTCKGVSSGKLTLSSLILPQLHKR